MEIKLQKGGLKRTRNTQAHTQTPFHTMYNHNIDDCSSTALERKEKGRANLPSPRKNLISKYYPESEGKRRGFYTIYFRHISKC